MTFLIAEIVGLMMLAAVCGGAFVYWWHRRNLVDVSGEYATYQKTLMRVENLQADATETRNRLAHLQGEKAQVEQQLHDERAWRARLEPKLEALAPVSVDPVMAAIGMLHESVAKFRPADLTQIEARLDAVSSQVGALSPTDLSELQTKIASVETMVRDLENADLSVLESKLASTSAAIAAVKPTDIDPILQRLNRIEERVVRVRPADLSKVEIRLAALEESLHETATREADGLSSIHQQLHELQAGLASNVPVRSRRASKKPRRTPNSAPGGNLLDSAVFGDPDDLKRISGVGPKLERMLNDIGVYYFWQVAEWSSDDIEAVDEKLQVFKGRIARDQWVAQGQQLASEMASAQRPELIGQPQA